MTVTYRAVIVVAIWTSVLTADARADMWPQFRGATGSGISAEKDLPVRWSTDGGLRWTVDLPGQANSSPVVTARRVDLTTQTDDDACWVLSFDRNDGRLLRKTQVGQGRLVAEGAENLYVHRHNAATPTPVADDRFIWAFFGTGDLICLDAATHEVVWQRDLVADYGEYEIRFGMASSPRLFERNLCVACMTKSVSYVVAFDKITGEQVWKHDRLLPSTDDGPDAYSSPALYRGGGGTALLVSGSDHVNAYRPDTGEQVWLAAGLKIDSPFGRVIASPVASADGIVVATSGNPPGGGLGHVIAARFDPSAEELWRVSKSTPDSSTPVIVNGRVFMVSDNGIASCLDLRNGRTIWQTRLGKGPFHASVVAGDGKVYFLGIDGVCVVTKDDDSGELLSRNQLVGTFYATPAICGGTIYLRSYDKLYAVAGE